MRLRISEGRKEGADIDEDKHQLATAVCNSEFWIEDEPHKSEDNGSQQETISVNT